MKRYRDFANNSYIPSGDDRNEFYFRGLVIEIIVEEDLDVLVNRKKTRKTVKYLEYVKKKLFNRRNLRMKEENHLNLSFYEDVMRTQNELRHTLIQLSNSNILF